MSIFKETFKDFVFKQLRIREAIIEQGNAIKDPTNFASRFGSPRTNIKGKKITIDKGAFYTNSVNKQCVIRMLSGVDITDSDLLEAGSKHFGSTLAKRYILEGGTLKNPTGQGGNTPTPRSGGIGRGGAYGSSYIRSDAKDGFGIVPMPGIVDANIRTKTAYGSLREAKVNFVCHNRRQLDVLELLYMRPGFPILLEWQWSPFINNDGKIDNALYGVGDDWWDKNKNINNFNLKVINQKKLSGGNYDGFVGFCKNFEIKSRPDGGYDCTTELIAAGEVLEGLKARRDGYSKNQENTDDFIEIDNMELLLEGIFEIGEVNMGNHGVSKEQALEYDLIERAPLKILPNTPSADLLEALTGIEVLETEKGTSNYVAGTFESKYDKKYFIWEGEYMKIDMDFGGTVHASGTHKSKHTYIRWDLLCELMNELVFPLSKGDDSKDPLIKLTYTQLIEKKKHESFNWKTNTYTTIEAKNIEEYLEFVPHKLPSDLSIVENNNEDNVEKITFMTEGVLNNSYDPSVCLLPHQNPNHKNPQEENYIGHIMLNVKHLKETYTQMAYSGDTPVEDFNLFNYLKKIWSDINQACVGHHNFILQTELERPERVRIIDLQVDPPENIKPGDLFEFKIQSNKSIVRDFNYNTTIPSSLSATIAIAAQAPTSVSDLDQVTFANFSKGIKSRFSNNVNISPKNINKDNLKSKLGIYQQDKDRYNKNIIDLGSYQKIIQEAGYNVYFNRKGDTIDGKTFSEIISLAKSVETLLYSLLSRNPKNGEKLPIIPARKSAIIPLKFNAKMDGIGGIVIGHVFKVEKDKLPKGYQSDDVAFVVMGESQNITSGQDWTTEISGQLILLDSGEIREKVPTKQEHHLTEILPKLASGELYRTDCKGNTYIVKWNGTTYKPKQGWVPIDISDHSKGKVWSKGPDYMACGVGDPVDYSKERIAIDGKFPKNNGGDEKPLTEEELKDLAEYLYNQYSKSK